MAMSLVMLAEPIGKTAKWIKSPSSKTARPEVPAPISKSATPNSFCRGLRQDPALAIGEGIISKICSPEFKTAWVKFFK